MTNPEKRRLIDRIKTIEERLLLVVNPMSKKGSESASNIRSMVRREGMFLEETSTDHPQDMGQTVQFWSKRFGGSRGIMVFGGDGALNQVVNNVMLSRSNKNVVVVPLPAGTANDFCRAIGLDSVETALEAMIDFNIHTVDLLKVDISGVRNQVKYCTNILGLGLDGDLARRSQKYKRFGVPGYWYASLKRAVVVIIRGIDMYRVKLKAGDLEYDGRLVGVFFSNIAQYGRTFKVAPGASPDDGKIHVVLAKPMSGIRALIAALMMQVGMHTRMPGVESVACDEVDVELLDDLYAQEDGEVIFYPRGTHIHLTLERQALNVLSPNSSASPAPVE
ncbi:MAG: hypothetical protein KKF41_09395 [Actinobacteria bacterium]|nr:hypothetical protein [Actinomycetota bacterium]